MKKYFLIIILSSLCSLSKAQNENSTQFSNQQLKQFDNQVKGYVNDFCFFLGDLADKSTIEENKPQLKKNLLSLFINTATIEVRSVARPTKGKKYPIQSYLNMVANYSNKYRFVVLEFDQVVVNGKNLRDTIINGQTLFFGTFSYRQKFIAANSYDGSNINFNNNESLKLTDADFKKAGSDITIKTGIFYIVKKETRSEKDGVSYYIKLGDITAGEPIPLKK
jgi:hypothetical protein